MAIKNVYQRQASAVGKYNKSLFDAMAEENIGNIRIQGINERTERYSALLDTAAAGVVYAEAKDAENKQEEKRKQSFENVQKIDTGSDWMHKRTTFRDYIAGDAKLRDVGSDSYHRRTKATDDVKAGEWSEVSGGTLDAIWDTTRDHEVANILGLKLENDQENLYNKMRADFDESKLVKITEGSYFGAQPGFDWGDIFGENNIFNTMFKNKYKNENFKWSNKKRKRDYLYGPDEKSDTTSFRDYQPHLTGR